MSRTVLTVAAAFAVSLAALPASAQDGHMTVATFLNTADDIPRNPTAMLRADTLLARFNAIPASRRNITVTQAMREWMAEEHPCPA